LKKKYAECVTQQLRTRQLVFFCTVFLLSVSLVQHPGCWTCTCTQLQSSLRGFESPSRSASLWDPLHLQVLKVSCCPGCLSPSGHSRCPGSEWCCQQSQTATLLVVCPNLLLSCSLSCSKSSEQRHLPEPSPAKNLFNALLKPITSVTKSFPWFLIPTSEQ
jgi:hypothetical protein